MRVSGRAISRAGVGGALACLLVLSGIFARLGLRAAPVSLGPFSVDLLSRAVMLPALFAFLVLAVVGLFRERAEEARRMPQAAGDGTWQGPGEPPQ